VRQVRLRGKVDRVDLFHDGTFRIVDYKTGGTPAVKDTVQLQVYAAAVAQALRQEGYSGLTPASASFVSLTKAPASSASLPGRGHSMEDRVRDGEGRLLRAIDDIAAGRFPPKPAQASTCDRCSFASVCRKDIVGEDAHDEPGQGGDDE
jgi:RecB family exonuclease